MKTTWVKHLWRFALSAIAIFIFALAMRALYRLTKTVHYQDVLDAISRIPTTHLIIATLVVAFGYLILTLYDFIAMRQIGRKIDYPHVALTSFTAYAISHTVGVNLVTASGIRYRNYSRFNLSNNEIANIVWMVSMAFTFGISTLIGASLTSHPEITVQLLSQLDQSWGIFENIVYVRALGVGILSLIALVIWYAGRQGRHVFIRGWRFDLPPAKIILQQTAIAIVDLGTVALVLYLLLPPSDHISYWATFSAFIQSMAVGILSHVPGGLGVFEVVMISALPTVDRTQMLAVLLVFRLLYYIAPFLIALSALIVYETWLFFAKKK
ncbi:MAG: UPF0104 family protein [Moraxella sp.]|jgi:uncharacterized membrane protein YbhN (UPF0104 family)